jgi:GNAT superfamily N-acetyltransferase
MTWSIDTLSRDDLAAATEILAAACAFDRAAAVADEKLFGADPTGPAVALGARRGGELVGVAAIGGNRLRVLAVRPDARGHGAGGALLDAAIDRLRATNANVVRTLDLPGNYLAPGIDARNALAIGWLERRGFRALDKRNCDLVIDVANNSQVSAERAAMLTIPLATIGYEVRRARADEGELLLAIASDFGGAWPWEVAMAMGGDPPGVWVAVRDREYAAFAAHDGNNRGLGWFGPAGTWPDHRGRGLGEALLVACLVDVAARHPTCEVAWIGPREFYRRVAGIAGEREFVVLQRALG